MWISVVCRETNQMAPNLNRLMSVSRLNWVPFRSGLRMCQSCQRPVWTGFSHLHQTPAGINTACLRTFWPLPPCSVPWVTTSDLVDELKGLTLFIYLALLYLFVQGQTLVESQEKCLKSSLEFYIHNLNIMPFLDMWKKGWKEGKLLKGYILYTVSQVYKSSFVNVSCDKDG